MKLLTLLALGGLAAGIAHHRRWRAERRRLLLAAPPEEPVIAVVTMETGIATGI